MLLNIASYLPTDCDFCWIMGAKTINFCYFSVELQILDHVFIVLYKICWGEVCLIFQTVLTAVVYCIHEHSLFVVHFSPWTCILELFPLK